MDFGKLKAGNPGCGPSKRAYFFFPIPSHLPIFAMRLIQRVYAVSPIISPIPGKKLGLSSRRGGGSRAAGATLDLTVKRGRGEYVRGPLRRRRCPARSRPRPRARAGRVPPRRLDLGRHVGGLGRRGRGRRGRSDRGARRCVALAGGRCCAARLDARLDPVVSRAAAVPARGTADARLCRRRAGHSWCSPAGAASWMLVTVSARRRHRRARIRALSLPVRAAHEGHLRGVSALAAAGIRQCGGDSRRHGHPARPRADGRGTPCLASRRCGGDGSSARARAGTHPAAMRRGAWRSASALPRPRSSSQRPRRLAEAVALVAVASAPVVWLAHHSQYADVASPRIGGHALAAVAVGAAAVAAVLP